MFVKRFLTAAGFLVASSALAAPSGKGHTHTASGQICDHGKDQFFTGHIHSTNHFDFNEDNQKVAKTHTHADFMVNFTEKIGIFAGLKLEQDHSHGHGGHDDHDDHGDEDTDNNYFEDHVLYIDQLYLDLVLIENLSLQAGKMKIPIGFGMHEYPGYYGYEVQEEMMLLEKIAFNLKYEHGFDNGAKLTLDASTFFSDTTLNESAINSREEQLEHEDGGPANTEDFSSFALGFRLDNLYFMTDDYIHEFVVLGGYALQAEGDGEEHHDDDDDEEHGADDEERFILGGKYIFHYDENTRLSLMNEIIDISSYGGSSEADVTAINWGASFSYNNWRVGGTYTDYLHDSEHADEENDGRAVQVSAGYFFDFGLGVEVGYQKMKEVGEEDDSEGPGISVSYIYEF